LARLPAVTGNEAVRALQRGGFRVRRQTGSHVILTHLERGGRVSVPVHGARTLGRGLLHDILRQAGLTTGEFIRLLT
jgi:predicted RNA binding protein YcfA (HicA-like mRNA interferase family)